MCIILKSQMHKQHNDNKGNSTHRKNKHNNKSTKQASENKQTLNTSEKHIQKQQHAHKQIERSRKPKQYSIYNQTKTNTQTNKHINNNNNLTQN